MNWLLTKPIAHRGLHNDVAPKNSLAAFKNAIEKGLPFEIDVRLTADEVLVVCHDDDITDVHGKSGTVSRMNYDQLCTFDLSESGHKIPQFVDVLNLTQGQVGILIEIKNFSQNRRTEEVLVEQLKGYQGPYVVQTFNPLALKWLKANAPDIKRGVLSCSFTDDVKMSRMRKFLLSNMLLNPFAKPNFIAYDYNGLPKGAVKRARLPVLAWTVTSEEKAWELINKGVCTNIIFEDFLPSNELIEKISDK